MDELDRSSEDEREQPKRRKSFTFHGARSRHRNSIYRSYGVSGLGLVKSVYDDGAVRGLTTINVTGSGSVGDGMHLHRTPITPITPMKANILMINCVKKIQVSWNM